MTNLATDGSARRATRAGAAALRRTFGAVILLMASLPLAPIVVTAGYSAEGPASDELPPLETLPRQPGRAVPSLPTIRPKAPPPGLAAPPLPPQPAPAGPLSRASLFVLRGVKIDGNTIIDQPSIQAIVKPCLGKPVSVADLDEMRRQFTLLYIKRGYINSGALIPNQKVANGIIRFRFVEGHITGIDVSGTKSFSPNYFRERLQQAAKTPFNIKDLELEQQIVLQNPLVKRLNIEVLPGLEPGEARLHADVLEASPYSFGASITNDQSPTVGEVRGALHGAVANLLGRGDILAAEYGRSLGIDDGYVAYSTPIAPDDTRINVRYDRNGTLVIAPGLSPLNITSDYSSISGGVSRPFYRTATQDLTLGLDLERRRAQSFLFGLPFSFTAGAVNGTTNVTALRFYQAWLDRDAEHAFAVRSTLSFGLPILGATVTKLSPTGTFFSWLGQAQYVRRIFKDWEALVRSDLQLSHDALFPIEQFALGGFGTVRGYRTYLTVTDDAFVASGELHIPIGKLRVPYLAQGDEAGTVQLVPFYDYGRGWNVGRPTPYPPDISSVGLGFRWLVGSGITAELYYAKGLRHVPVGTSLEDRGILFRITTAFF